MVWFTAASPLVGPPSVSPPVAAEASMVVAVVRMLSPP
jgi:hypothetical protein